jgi:hypothetical protein
VVFADLVTEKMNEIEGIERTDTMIAFRAYSRYELEKVFSIGMESQSNSTMQPLTDICSDSTAENDESAHQVKIGLSHHL